MPQYATTVLFVFVLATCFYKKHVQDWKLFRLGIYLLVASIATVMLSGLLRGGVVFSDAGKWLYGSLSLLAGLAELAAFGAMVLACMKSAELTVGLRCPGCGYTLKGLSEPRCPECGFRI